MSPETEETPGISACQRVDSNATRANAQASPQTVPIVGTRFFWGPIMMLDSHMKDPSQYDLQRVGLKSLPLVTGRCSGLDFRGIPVEKGVGFEYLSPTASHLMGLGSSDLIRGSLRSYSGYPTVGFFYDVHVLLRCFHPWSLFFWRQDGSPPPDSLTFSFILACVRCPSSTCRVNLYKTDICPISLIPELLGMVDKAEEQALLGAESYRGRVVGITFPRYFRFPYKFVPIPLFPMELWVCRGLNCPRLHLRTIFCFIFLSQGCNLFRLGPLDSP